MMELNLRGKEVGAVDVGYTIAFTTVDGYELRIEREFVIRSSGGEFTISPGPVAESMSDRLRPLEHQRIDCAVVGATGTLTVTFANQAQLYVEPDQRYEAWTLAGPRGVIAVSAPGGEVAEFADGES